jgi:hypothetical protein
LCYTRVSNRGLHAETDADSALKGTLVLDDIRLAVQKEYKVLLIYEVFEYQVTKYNPQTGDAGFFADYINIFLKLKPEATGYPNCLQCPEDEDRYISEFQRSEGFQLDKEKYRLHPC